MSFGVVTSGDVSANSKTANQSSAVLTMPGAGKCPVDCLAVLIVAVDNNQTTDGDEGAVSGVTDTHGNTWLKAAEFTNGQGGAQAGATCSIWYSMIATALASSESITVSFTNSTSRDASAIAFKSFTRDTSKTIEIEGTPATLANDNADPGSLDVTTANIECLRVRGIAAESNSTTALTPTTNWTAFQGSTTSGGGSTANMAVRGEYRIFTGTSSASDPTLYNADCASVYVAFKEVSGSATLDIDSATYVLTGQAVVLERDLQLPITAASYALTDSTVELQKGYTLNVDPATYSLAAQDVIFEQDLQLVSTNAVYSITGSTVALERDLILIADSATYSMADQAVALEVTLPADSTTYTLTGQDVSLERDLILVSDPAAYVLTAQDVSLDYTPNGNEYTLDVDPATCAFTGASVTLEVTLSTDPATYSISGQDVTFERDYALVNDSATYSLTGSTVSLERDLQLAIAEATYLLAGSDISLDTGNNLEILPATYAVTGQDIALERDLQLPVTVASCVLTGSEVSLDFNSGPAQYDLDVDPAIYTVTTQDVSLERDLQLSATPATALLSEQDVSLERDLQLPVTATAYALSTQNVAFHRGYNLLGTNATYTISGQDVEFGRDLFLGIEPAVYTINGQDMEFTYSGTYIPRSPFTYTLHSGVLKMDLVHNPNQLALGPGKHRIDLDGE